MQTRAEIKQTLTRLLEEERGLLLQLESLLDQEKAILLRDDSPEQLESACRSRQDCMVALMRLQDERQNLLRLSGFSSDNAGLAGLIKVCDPERALPPRWAECAELARRCRDLNDHNGALVASRMRRIQGMLEVITGKRSEKMTYGRHAQQGFGSRGRVLVTEA
ncbi:MAG: flagella synthesis protein FlgN [Gammaproteobacteria bacterium]|jgi:flagellar biosynthesis/type III secretory pathway chaperone|nr:flagellar protein FlgN [Gammaproteobacteria bacterium]